MRDIVSRAIDVPSESRADGRDGRRRGDDREDLELDHIGPPYRPLPEQLGILALHDLKTAAKVLGDPARHIAKALRRHPPLLPKASVHRHRIPIPKMLDDHVLHAPSKLALPEPPPSEGGGAPLPSGLGACRRNPT